MNSASKTSPITLFHSRSSRLTPSRLEKEKERRKVKEHNKEGILLHKYLLLEPLRISKKLFHLKGSRESSMQQIPLSAVWSTRVRRSRCRAGSSYCIRIPYQTTRCWLPHIPAKKKIMQGSPKTLFSIYVLKLNIKGRTHPRCPINVDIKTQNVFFPLICLGINK